MRIGRLSQEQIIGILRGHGHRGSVPPTRGLSSATFYAWKSNYGGLEVSEAKRLKMLEDENRKLKKMLAEQMRFVRPDVVGCDAPAPDESEANLAILDRRHLG